MTDLFTEQARRQDPVSSYKNADRLHKTPELTRRFFAVLKSVRENPGKTAGEIGIIMYSETSELDRAAWGHKVASRLEDAGWIQRTPRHLDGRFQLWITIQGEKELAKYERNNRENQTD